MAVQVRTAPYDARFPSMNQARNCYTRYNEFYRCAPPVACAACAWCTPFAFIGHVLKML